MSGAEQVGQDPWSGDLLNRKDEAQLLIGYIESVVGRPTDREDSKAHTIAVDAGYGEGKTFFLRRLAVQLGQSHPVAFVDAWTDDLADEPLTALVFTLKKALDPLIERSATIKEKWEEVLRRTGKVAKIVAFALAKRGLSVAMGTAAVEAAEAVIGGVGEAAKDALEEGLKDTASSSVEGAVTTLTSIAPNQLIRKRIEEFEQGREAIDDLKRSLAALIAALGQEELSSPIIIIVDELDRCRPTYAIKLLEEVKHLFDVPGLVFIFGMHTEQLAQSVAGAYGSQFDGKGYLRRFLNRQYRLAQPNLEPLITKLLGRTQGLSSLYTPRVQGFGIIEGSTAHVIAAYMRAYGMKARDAFEVMDILQTAVAITQGHQLHLPYLLPLIFGHLKGMRPGELPRPANVAWHLLASVGRSRIEVGPAQLAEQYREASLLSDDELQEVYNSPEGMTFAVRAVANERHIYSEVQPMWAIESYPKLVGIVSRFTNPQIVEAVGKA